MHNKSCFFLFFQKHIFEQHIFPFTNIDQRFSKQKKNGHLNLALFFLERRYFWPDDSDKRQGI